MSNLFIGRFQPFHKGHLKTIKWILRKNKQIFIVIGSLQEFSTKENPFSFRERKEMIKSTLLAENFKNFKIYGVPDFFDDILWPKTILKILKIKKEEITVFTKSSWTKRCFEKVGVKIKPYPLFFNGLSATQIREKIRSGEKWKNLVPPKVFSFLKEIKGEERIKFSGVPFEKRIINFIKEKVRKAGAKGVVVGVSGGIDSSLVSLLIKKALGPKATFLWLPILEGNSTPRNILLLEKKLNIKIKKISLKTIYQNLLKIIPSGDGISRGNLQPRLRMTILYYFANLHNFLVIGTTNKSELEIGYFTKHGDGAADIKPIADLYKTEIIETAKRLKLPKEIIEASPTAGLWPGQTDEKEIGISYQKLDMILKLLAQGFKEKEISFLTNIPIRKVKMIIKRKKKNLHKLYPPSFCQLKF